MERSKIRLGVPEKAAKRRVSQMGAAFPFAAAEGYEQLIAVMTNDSRDRHVLAAAVISGCDTNVTFNLRDFPDSVLSGWLVRECAAHKQVEDLVGYWRPSGVGVPV